MSPIPATAPMRKQERADGQLAPAQPAEEQAQHTGQLHVPEPHASRIDEGQQEVEREQCGCSIQARR